MPKSDAVYTGHMLDMARKAVARARSKSRAQYDGDEDLRFVLAHLVQTIGEAAARVSASACQAHPEIPWKQIVGIRNRIVHDYMDVDYDVLYEVVSRDLPRLIPLLETIVPREKS